VTSLPCAPLHDDMWFDRAGKRIYVTGSETTTVFEQKMPAITSISRMFRLGSRQDFYSGA